LLLKKAISIYNLSTSSFTITSSKYSRLIIVTLNHLHKFGSLEEVQKDLSPRIMSLVPEDCANKDKIPYLKIGDNIGKRATVYHDKGIIIEDVQDFDGTVIRKLFFEIKLEQTQSEVNIKSVGKEEEEMAPLTKSEMFPEDGKMKVIVNHKVLCSDYAREFVTGLATIPELIMKKEKFKVLLLGTGAGVFPMFLKQNVPNAFIQTVDRDPEILKVIFLLP